MKTHASTIKNKAKKPENVRNCERSGSSRQLCAYTANNFGNIPIAPKKVALRNSRLANQPFEKVLAKAGRVRNREAHVFVKVKHLHARSYYARHRGQSIQKFELRGACCSNDSCPIVVLNRITQ